MNNNLDQELVDAIEKVAGGAVRKIEITSARYDAKVYKVGVIIRADVTPGENWGQE